MLSMAEDDEMDNICHDRPAPLNVAPTPR